jgi:gamma-glutamyltranspeptidase/glutathione hydrolase
MPNGATPKEGQVFRNPVLAGTLRRIAKGGREAFYEGEIAKEIEEFCAKVAGCFLTREDLSAHHAEWVPVLNTTYRGFQVFELPPNGQVFIRIFFSLLQRRKGESVS